MASTTDHITVFGRSCFLRPSPIATDSMLNGPPDTTGDAEAALLHRYAAGDRAAARLLAARLTPRIFGHALRVLADSTEAEDVTQEALLRLWRIAPDWREGEARVTTWLYRVVANLCNDRLRKRPAVPLDQVAEPADPAPSVMARIQDGARMDALQTALNDLPARQRQAVVLRHIDGLTNPEIAQVLGIGVEAVESLTARGKRALTQALATRRGALGYQDDET